MVWTLGLIALLSAAVLVGARYRSRSEASFAASERAAAAAESAVNLAILITLTPPPAGTSPYPLQCRMPGGEQVEITVSQENGKVDLNASSAQMLANFFAALAGERAAGERIAASIMAFRGPKQGDSPQATARRGGFQSILELDRIPGVGPELFRAALPFVTVRSRRSEPDAGAASKELREMLQLEKPSAAQSRGDGDITIRADTVVGPARFIREALISPRAENGRPFVIREWRRSDADSPAPIYDPGDLRPCLAAMEARS
ncbi:type II secretion system protein GspK [Bradyrhizobium sp. Tv2a-2]|uniref:ComEA family DNA-binding protein n=1 Tax=Bradyrhizobium sp. Tv2a-2 TaxID=113395 RepID=UPI0004649A30|nr:type II secretion system protein GspK [Bradyrhizobium sp. Tv2a-2]